MTARLVALMSAVLFLSLLAFSVLLDHSRTAVLEEVEKTVRVVGSETLHAMFGSERDRALRTRAGVPHEPMVRFGPTGFWAAESRLRIVREVDARGETGGPTDAAGARAATDSTDPSDPNAPTQIEQRTTLRGFVIAHDDPRTVHRGDEEIEVSIAFLTTDAIQVHGQPGEHAVGPFPQDATFVMEPAIPALQRPFHGPTPNSAPVTNENESPARPATAQRDELVFRVPVDEYARMFDAIRERMLWLFIGVLLLGVALSTALARRFTRPIRDLDEALQRVTAGELDVAVEPAGGPEVGRLAVAFNTMTAELRKNRDRERELIRREKMSALGRLAAGVAHDVRNPLHSIGLTLQNLEEVCRPQAEESRGVFERAVGLIRREVKRLDSLVSGFLSFARSDAGAKQTVCLPELVRETANLVAKESERRGITVVVDAEPTLPAIGASPGSLRSAILNLVLNAFEATPRGGTVTLRVTAEGHAQVLEVADTGRGIPEGDRERVFDFGFTTREGGTGLGLAMVHHTIVEEHGGRIAIDSAEGRGTRVRVELPTTGAAA